MFYRYAKVGFEGKGIRIQRSDGKNADDRRYNTLLFFSRLVFGVTGFGGWVYTNRFVDFFMKDIF